MNLQPTEKQARILWFALTGLAVATVILLIVAAVWGLSRLLDVSSPVLWPLAVAAVVACGLAGKTPRAAHARHRPRVHRRVRGGRGRAGERGSTGRRRDAAACVQ